MPKAKARTYLSPTLVLLALDWPGGSDRNDFLGFAIRRKPGFGGAEESWLPNRIGFDGPRHDGGDIPSNEAPIQKFMWWDARFEDDDHNRNFTYTVYPVVGNAEHLEVLIEEAAFVRVVLPDHVEHGIGTWFNRAVVSSQAFENLLKKCSVNSAKDLTEEMERTLRTWLANGLECVIPEFIEGAGKIEGAIYHLTDELWVVPALAGTKKKVDLVYDAVENKKDGKVVPGPNRAAVKKLSKKVKFHPRKRASIMHNKFLVDIQGGTPARVLCGSANYTTEGLTSQANLLHTLESPGLAQAYLERKQLLQKDPTLGTVAEYAGWSYMETVGDAGVRVFFSPEPKDERESIDTIVQAIHAAQSSVIFCLFTPTDKELRDACFAAGDNGKMMFGLVNCISELKEEEEDPSKPVRADKLAAIELYHRSRKNRDVIGQDWFRKEHTPHGFFTERQLFPGAKRPPYTPVIIHHKFVVIDAEGDSPVIFSGSANMSKNSLYNNDENLLEIRGCKRLAAIYLAEFMRLYEHYRARAAWNTYVEKEHDGYNLAPDRAWAKKHFTPGTPEFKSRIAMAD